MPRAKDIMTRNVICVKEETPIYEAVALIAKNNITGVPVVGDDMTLVGVVSEKDVLRLFDVSREDGEGKSVSDFMTQPAVTFGESERLSDICDCLMNNHFRRVPVVSSKGKLVGIITRRDIIYEYILHLEREKTGID
jgi:CBS domain-containing protein